MGSLVDKALVEPISFAEAREKVDGGHAPGGEGRQGAAEGLEGLEGLRGKEVGGEGELLGGGLLGHGIEEGLLEGARGGAGAGPNR